MVIRHALAAAEEEGCLSFLTNAILCVAAEKEEFEMRMHERHS